jgi:murein L,D-transpeptidase YcbB/YkuD
MMRMGRIWRLAMGGAAVVAVPLAAQSMTPQLAVPTASAAPAAPSPAVRPLTGPAASRLAIDLFYTSRNNPQVWLGTPDGRAAATRLPALLRKAQIDGLAEGPALAMAVQSAIARGQPADDRIISAAWVHYVQAIKRPVPGVHYGDPALAIRGPTIDSVLADARRAPSLSALVDQIAAVNPLYAALRETAEREGATADPRVRATLDRLRLVPAKGRAILVDAASAQLWMLEDGRAVDTMKVIVGKKKSATPLLAGTIHYITFNPYWNLPDDVARRNVAPLVIKRGVKYLKSARYVTADSFGQQAALVDAASIDWKAVAAGEAPVHLRQLPGSSNMMGAMKFGFVNDHDIFLHDTPGKQLFARDDRTLSMGCIRLEHADRLGRWLLGREPEAPSPDPEQHVQLEVGVPVYVSYMTAKVADGRLAFAEDIYGLEPRPDTSSEPKLEVAAAVSAPAAN